MAVEPDPLTACTFAGDGRVATGSSEGRLQMWSWDRAAEDGAAIQAHVRAIQALVWDARRDLLISGGYDGLIAIHERRGKRRGALTAHTGGVHALAISRDGAWLASGGYDRTIRVWRLDDLAPIAVLSGHEGAVTALDFLPDGRLASGARDDSVRVWNVNTSQQTAIGRGHRKWVTKVRAVSGIVVSVSEDGSARGWHADTGIERWRHAPEIAPPIWGLACSGRRLILGRGGSTDICTLGENGLSSVRQLTTETARAIAADGNRFALGAGRTLFFLEDERVRARIDLPDAGVLSLAAGRDTSGAVRFVSGRADGAVLLRDGAAWRKLSPPHDAFTYTAERVGPGLFATGGFDRMVRLWRDDGEPAGVLPHGGLVFSIGADPSGSRLLAAGGTQLSLWDTTSGRNLWRTSVPDLGGHNWAALSADGRTAFGAGECRALHRWTLSADGTEAVHEPAVALDVRLITGFQLLPEPKAAVIATADGEVRELDLESGRTILLHAANEAHVRSFGLSPDGRFVVSASEFGVAAVYDRAAGRLATPPDMARRAVPAAAFAPTGDLAFLDGAGNLHLAAMPRD
jgi:WD40 repeat protein